MTILNCVSAGPIKRFSIKIVAFFHNWQHSFLGLVHCISNNTNNKNKENMSGWDCHNWLAVLS
jgi:enoyl-[acyl-carrier-protein] reductase (NADH)